MHDNEYRNASDKADRMPALLAFLYAIRKDNMQRIIPDTPRQLERHVVLGEIAPSLGRVPFEAHFNVQ